MATQYLSLLKGQEALATSALVKTASWGDLAQQVQQAQVREGRPAALGRGAGRRCRGVAGARRQAYMTAAPCPTLRCPVPGVGGRGGSNRGRIYVPAG